MTSPTHHKDLRNYAKSSSFYMAVLYTVLCAGTAFVLGYFINYFAQGHFIHSTDTVINAKTKLINLLPDVTALDNGADSLIMRFNENNRPVFLSKDIKRLKEGIVLFDHPKTGSRMAGKIHKAAAGENLLVATNISETLQDYQFMQMLAIISVLLIFLIVVVSYFISVFVVQGTNRIANTAREIMRTGDLSRRLEITSSWDDLSNMAQTLNLLLDRIEELMQGISQVSDNIAHDLRTPLTRMKNHLEDLKRDKTDPQKAYDSLIEEADHILKTFNALLRISRIQTEKQKKQFIDLDLSEVLKDVIEFYEPLAEEYGISFKTDIDHIAFKGDRDLLFQAFANLMDNALKFSPKDGHIDVSLKKHSDHSIIARIRDNGPGLNQGEEEKIFIRFFRGEKSRTTAGTGLGLSLVAAVIDLHGGTIRAQNTNPGTEFVTIF